MQTKCLRLMGKKLLVALTLEGKFAGEGLHDLEDDDDDILAALARELVEKDGVGQSADAIWSNLKEIYDQLPTAAEPLAAVEDESADLPAFEPPSEFTVFEPAPLSSATQGELLITGALNSDMPTVFGQTLSAGQRKSKRRHTNVPEQTSLFNWN